ncbi:HAD domain-containing protein [Actinokineospora enzanensis]|uniref:HAD domain-containing protein n=1 Tax=Actinokineospora enzanensis TaxID=155975 RepID=UPI001B7FA5B6|nr:HAD domain-containing protein [Actinokineospora enzanensis]
MPERPLLFLDIDGTLLPFGPTDTRPASPPPANPLLAGLDPTHGARLLALPCDLMWATTWMHEANEILSPALGLPRLPVVDFPDSLDQDLLHWKTRTLARTAATRPFIWLDDEITALDRTWVSRHHPTQALLHPVDPSRGLTPADFTILAEWLRATNPA